jgi:hypothetical protein
MNASRRNVVRRSSVVKAVNGESVVVENRKAGKISDWNENVLREGRSGDGMDGMVV